MLKKLRNAFIAGLILTAPLGVTLVVVNFLRGKLGRPVSEFFLETLKFTEPSAALSIAFDILAILIVVICIIFIGLISNYFIGGLLIRYSERIIFSIPIVNTIYKNAKQIVETLSKNQKALFSEVVVIEYPRKGLYVIGFLTSDAYKEIQEKTSAKLINVFIPTTPNPTSGFLLMVPETEILRTKLTVGEGMKLIVSGGAVTPESMGELEQKNERA